MDTKVCSKCGVEKALCEFYNNKNTKDGKSYECKECIKQQNKIYREANKSKVAERKKAYREANREKCSKQEKAWREANQDRVKQTRKSHYDKHKKQILEKNKEQDRSAYWASYTRNKRRNDPARRIRDNASRAVNHALKKQGSAKGGSTFSALPYSPQDLLEHLERQFDDKMNWENYGSYWDVDHIYPQSLLPYDSLDHPNFQKCWALDNLQPLEKSENQRKSNKILDD
tara:strand:+ start:41 stop:727 length:687 start_codon:yes stop_codon:yes gene_type:complete